MSEINMTPLIDVMLVLLVIFIVAAPLMASSLRLDLPRTEGARATEALNPVAISIDGEGRIYLGSQVLPAEQALAQLSQRARDAARTNPATEVHLRADARVPYGRVAEIIGLVQEAGLSRIGFVTEAASPAR